MHSSSGRIAARVHCTRTSRALAAAALVLGLALAGCTPAPPAAGPTAGPTEGSPAPTEPTEPTEPSPSGGDGATPADQGGSPGDGSGAETTGTDDDAPGTAAPEGDDGAGGEGGADSVIHATDDWQAPDDPTHEGPTAAPALPEVNGELEEAIALPTEVTVSLTSITSTRLTAETPGEVTGPAVIVEVQVTNDSEAPQTISSATVSLAAEDGEMGIPTSADPNDPLHGEVAPGATAEGVYVFMLDPADGRSVTVSVNYSAGDPVAVFTGATP